MALLHGDWLGIIHHLCILAITEGASVVSLKHLCVYQVTKVDLEQTCAAYVVVVRAILGELVH